MIFFNKKTNTSRGFTLIELLVVVSIVSFLSSTAFATSNTARSKSRDAVRKTTLRQLQNALELYYIANGFYPSTKAPISCYLYSSEPGDVTSNGPGNNGIWIPGLAPTYISTLPRDPRGGDTLNSDPSCDGWKSAYIYSGYLDNYILSSHCAPEGTWTSSDPFYSLGAPTTDWTISVGDLLPACSQ